MMDYTAARLRMVANQIRTTRITDPVIIAAMEELPREAFLPEHQRGIAYVDEAITLGGGRYLMEPLITAQLLQAAEIDADDVALDVGCGPGYGTAILARMASTVVALESEPALAATARQVLAELGTDTVTVVEGQLAQGYPAQAPYDVILFGGAISCPPPVIVSQLAEGGRMVAVVAEPSGVGRGTVYIRCDGGLSRRVVFDAGTPILKGFQPVPAFQF